MGGNVSTLYVDAAFVAIGHNPNTHFLSGNNVQKDENGYIKLIQGTQTSMPGIFAAGDVADHTYRQAVTSAGSGAKAALDVERFLSGQLMETSNLGHQEEHSSLDAFNCDAEQFKTATDKLSITGNALNFIYCIGPDGYW